MSDATQEATENSTAATAAAPTGIRGLLGVKPTFTKVIGGQEIPFYKISVNDMRTIQAKTNHLNQLAKKAREGEIPVDDPSIKEAEADQLSTTFSLGVVGGDGLTEEELGSLTMEFTGEIVRTVMGEGAGIPEGESEGNSQA